MLSNEDTAVNKTVEKAVVAGLGWEWRKIDNASVCALLTWDRLHAIWCSFSPS